MHSENIVRRKGMKKFYSLLVIALVAVMAFTLFAACDDPTDPNDPNDGEKQPIQVEGKVFAFNRVEASVIPGMEAALEAYIAEKGNPEIATVDDFLKIMAAGYDESFAGEKFVFYQGVVYMPDAFEFTQDGETVSIEGFEAGESIESYKFRVQGEEFVIEFTTGEDEALVVLKFIFAYDRDATQADVPGGETPGGEETPGG